MCVWGIDEKAPKREVWGLLSPAVEARRHDRLGEGEIVGVVDVGALYSVCYGDVGSVPYAAVASAPQLAPEDEEGRRLGIYRFELLRAGHMRERVV